MIEFHKYNKMVDETNKSVFNENKLALLYYYKREYQECIAAVNRALCQSEKPLIYLRDILFSFYSPTSAEAKEYNAEAASGLNISIEKCHEEYPMYKIVMPFFLPNQRSKWQGFTETIGSALHYLLNDYCSSNNIVPLSDCIIIFTTYINRDNNVYVSDNDNKEAKAVMNILTKNLIRDDNGLICDVMYRSRRTSEKNKTEIIVSDKRNIERLLTLLKQEKVL